MKIKFLFSTGGCGCYKDVYQTKLTVDQFKEECVVTFVRAGNFTERERFCGIINNFFPVEVRNSSNLFGRTVHLHPWEEIKVRLVYIHAVSVSGYIAIYFYINFELL